MDDLTLIRDFRAERDDGDPRARAAAWRELKAALEPAAAPTARATRSPRRSLLALAGVGALAAIVAGILVLGSGPTAQPAAAEALHQTAAVAASGEGAALQAGPGQYYFTKTKTLEFEGWIPGGETAGSQITSRDGGFSALLPAETESWMSPDGGDRRRETMDTPRFLSSAEQSRWEQAGSPLPLGFDPRYEKARGLEEMGGRHILEMSRGVLDVEDPKPASGSESIYPDLSNVPTDPRALRLAVQSGQVPGVSEPGDAPVDTRGTIEDLAGLLSYRPNASPALRAAAFDALAEFPGMALNREATDLVGRPGYAIGYDRGNGMREELIFDPTTSRLLGERTVLAEPELEPQWRGYEAGLRTRDVAYLQSEVVDSTGEAPSASASSSGPG